MTDAEFIPSHVQATPDHECEWQLIVETQDRQIAKLKAELEECADIKKLFEIQVERMEEAATLWQLETGNRHQLPDLAELLKWLMDRYVNELVVSEHKIAEIEAERDAAEHHGYKRGLQEALDAISYCEHCREKIEAQLEKTL